MIKFAIPAALTGLTLSAAAIAQAPNAPVNIVRAIQVAEAQTGGGAFEAELDHEGGKTYYEISLAKGRNLTEVRVDAASGKVISLVRPRLANWLPSWASDDMPSTPKRIGSMLEGIERQTSGTVREVGFDVEDGNEIYEVEVATAKGVAELRIDAATGKRMPVRYDD